MNMERIGQTLNEDAKGVYVISATPFTDDGSLDYPSLDRLIDFYFEQGVHGLTLLGVMGEAPKLNSQEQSQFMRHALRRIDGRRPVIVGVSNPGNDNLVALLDNDRCGRFGGELERGRFKLRQLEFAPVCLPGFCGLDLDQVRETQPAKLARRRVVCTHPGSKMKGPLSLE